MNRPSTSNQRSSIYTDAESSITAFTCTTESTGKQTQPGATWAQALHLTINSGFASGIPRSDGYKGVREGRERGGWIPRLKGVGRTGKAVAGVPEGMVLAAEEMVMGAQDEEGVVEEMRRRKVERGEIERLHAELGECLLVKEMMGTDAGRLIWEVFEARLRQLERRVERDGGEEGDKYGRAAEGRKECKEELVRGLGRLKFGDERDDLELKPLSGKRNVIVRRHSWSGWVSLSQDIGLVKEERREC